MPTGSMPTLADLGGTQALTTTAVVGTPERPSPETYKPGAEELAPGEIRVTVLGSGDPCVRRSQASGALLIEVGNSERDFFFFDLGSGSLANVTALGLPAEATKKLFLSHRSKRPLSPKHPSRRRDGGRMRCSTSDRQPGHVGSPR
jgi:ribonuclease Z